MNSADRAGGDPLEAGSRDEPATLTFQAATDDVQIASSPRPGQRFGHYQILRLLGHGGMGDVYEAADLENGRHVALKTSRSALRDEAHRARFLREGRLAASISHPNTVYVFGTEEIERVPIITTEIASRGSLRDRVAAEGPLAPPQAVETILEVIAGLEAATAAGVLHRDIKPSNCFVDGEGRIKVGDFGLSISTLTPDETHFTRTGDIVGTPAFASPEQLRGEPLDVRSDIYSVGATLYHLLAGHEPFEDHHPVRMIARVMQELPAPLRSARREVPRALDKIVVQCLAKDPADRPQSYTQLTRLLQPYRSTSPRPATLGQRALAGMIDLIIGDGIVGIPLRFILWTQSMQRLPTGGLDVAVGRLLPAGAFFIAYFSVSEGRWSASLGKLLVGLRVVGADLQPIGLRRSFVRAVLWTMALVVPGGLGLAVVFGPEVMSEFTRLNVWSSTTVIAMVGPVIPELIGLGILFGTARRGNGFAGLHDLTTCTRVVSKPAVEQTTSAAGLETAPVISPAAPRFGPYVVLDESFAPAGVMVGFDERLSRRVWIRRQVPGTPAVSPARRDLNRPGRLRWLNGSRAGDANWDAYEAVYGEPLLGSRRYPQNWAVIRRWLLDLAQEIAAESPDRREGTTPPLAPETVLVAGNRARLLDWRPGGVGFAPAVGPVNDTLDPAAWQKFLYDVATLGLCIGDQESTRQTQLMRLPLHARDFLADLAAGRFSTPAEAVQRLKWCARYPWTLSRRRRAAHLAVCSALPALILLFCVGVAQIAGRSLARVPTLFVIDRCLHRLEELDRSVSTIDSARERSSIEVYLVGHFRAQLVSPPGPAVLWLWPLIETRRPFVQSALAGHPLPSNEELSLATERLAPLIAAGEQDHERAVRLLLHWQLPVFVLLLTIVVMAAQGLISALAARGGAVMRLLDIAVLGPDGLAASRSRAFVRGLIAWMPGIASFVLMLPPFTRGPLVDVRFAHIVPTLVVLSVFVAGATIAGFNPQRGPQDWFARTRLIAR